MNDSNPLMLPKARKDRLIIKELPDETLVYDLDTDEAHCLNRTAALIFNYCDGNNGVAEISRLVTNVNDSEISEDVVWLALNQLYASNLIAQVPPEFANLTRPSRRQVVRTLGLTAAALPIIVSIIAPTPAQAASPCSAGDPCNSPADCCTAFPTCVTTGAPASRGCRA